MSDVPGFDILSEAAALTAFCELNRADGEPMHGEGGQRCTIEFYGPASDEYAKMQARQRKRMQNDIARKTDELLPQVARKRLADDLASITRAFIGFTFPGEHASETDMFRACYLEPRLGFIRDQGNAFVSDWGNFAAASSKS